MTNNQGTTSKCMAVRSGRSAAFLGDTMQPATVVDRDYIDWASYPCDVQKNILSYLDVNQIVQIYIYKPPHITDVTVKHALKIACQNEDCSFLRIYLDWNNDTFYRVCDFIDTFVKKLMIVGSDRGFVNENDREKVRAIIDRCKGVTSVRWTRLIKSQIHMICHRRLPHLKSISLYKSRLENPGVTIPTLKEFSAAISPGQECHHCSQRDLSYDQLINFLFVNPQLENVTLKVIYPRIQCCEFNEPAFIERVKIILRNNTRMQSFLIISRNDRVQLV